jgi:hypothetical protein
MSWSYDETALGTSTGAERINSVRLLIGDTDTNNQQVQNEEITFALLQTSDNIYFASGWMARTLASKYSRYVDVDLDGQLAESYSQLQKHYKSLADTLEYQGKKTSGGLGVAAGGISRATMGAVASNTDRFPPAFKRDQFVDKGIQGYDTEDYT